MLELDENIKKMTVRFDRLWQEYPKMLEMWMPNYQEWQKTTNTPFLWYAKTWQMMFVSNPNMQKRITDGGINIWDPFGMMNQDMPFITPFSQETSNVSSFESTKNFYEIWGKPWISFWMAQFKFNMEILQKFTEQLSNYWKK